jgi:hypothetical protein
VILSAFFFERPREQRYKNQALHFTNASVIMSCDLKALRFVRKFSPKVVSFENSKSSRLTKLFDIRGFKVFEFFWISSTKEMVFADACTRLTV